jgi:hypothetical protein
MECKCMLIVTIVSMCGSLQDAKGVAVRFLEGLSWVHMAHLSNEPYGPL